MQGLIQSQQSPDSRDDITPDTIKDKIQVPPQLQEAYQKLVAAGMTAMFSKESNKAAVDTLMRGKGSVAERLGQGIAGLLGMIVKSSNNTLPPQILIPAGVELLIQAADFLRKSGLAPINNKAIGDALDVMVTSVLQAGKLDVSKIAGFVAQKAGQPSGQPQMGV